LADAAMRCGRRWFQGQCAAKIAFSNRFARSTLSD
jgi:hypothetical protein